MSCAAVLSSRVPDAMFGSLHRPLANSVWWGVTRHREHCIPAGGPVLWHTDISLEIWVKLFGYEKSAKSYYYFWRVFKTLEMWVNLRLIEDLLIVKLFLEKIAPPKLAPIQMFGWNNYVVQLWLLNQVTTFLVKRIFHYFLVKYDLK